MSRLHLLYPLLTTLVAAAACDTPFEPEVIEPSFASAAATVSTAEVFTFDDPPAPTDGWSRATRSRGGVTLSVHATGLVGGSAYTVWAVVFNEPDGCSEECGEDDLFNPDAVVDVLYLAGNVVGGSGSSTFSGRRAAGDSGGSLFGALGVPAPGLLDPFAAEIHVIVRDHGPVVPAMMPAQIHTFEGACTGATSIGLGNGPNVCADVQFAVHLP